MKTSEIRKRFLDYFAARGHAIVPGSSLVPDNDATLLFTNSGMVQFKDVFLGRQTRDYRRAVTAQRCVRAGGKHNDLENVGYTARHHTFFEMLGNFSFGDYFKAEAIAYAWELLTGEFALPAERLWVTVFEDDDEAERIWRRDIGIPAERFRRIGAHDNFWSMGDSGPCGPCSEIFYDHGPRLSGGPPGSAEQEGDRFVEIWNLVFMQFNRAAAGADGTLAPLPQTAVDTGMGLERIAAVLLGVHSNSQTDLFRNLMAAAAMVLSAAAELGAVGDGDGDGQGIQSLRVIADHIRSTAFLVVDGVRPSNEGRGYVLRRIIRRAARHGYRLGCRDPFMHKLVRPLIAEMGDAYPELAAAGAQVERVLRRENEKFAETLEQGLKLLDREIAGLSGKVISGAAAFRLYDTFGFPLDLTADVAREHGLAVDHAAFDEAMAVQRARARAASQFGKGGAGGGGDGTGADGANGANELPPMDGIPATRFLGYQHLRGAAKVLALFTGQPPAAVDALDEGRRGIVVLDATPFYAQSGGQVGDRGEIRFGDGADGNKRKGGGEGGNETGGAVFTVEDTRYLAPRVIGHIGTVARGRIAVGDPAEARVTADFRRRCARHHSATHLLHAALKAVLGDHVRQQGSLVEAARLRFDFSHSEAPSREQIAAVEDLVNRTIRANTAVATEPMDLEQAKADGAEALFGEKYDARVRVVRMGAFSFELCGGTHVERTGDIGYFKIISESGIAAGVRRIEALGGGDAERWVARQLALLEDAAAALKSPPEEMRRRLDALLDGQREQRRRIQSLQGELATGGHAADAGAAAGATVREVNGVRVVAIRRDDADAPAMRAAVDQWKRKLGSGVVLVAGVHAGKATLIAGVTADLAARYPAGGLIETLAPLVGGRGGGKAELAQGGGGKVEGVDAAVDGVYRWVAESESNSNSKSKAKVKAKSES